MNRLGEIMPRLEALVRVRHDVAGPICSACDDTGWAPVIDQAGVRRVARCVACVERSRGQAPGVPDGERERSVAHYGSTWRLSAANQEAVTQAQHFLAGVHPGLYLHGGIGTGKTSLACAVLNDLHRAGTRVQFVRVTDLLRLLVQDDGEALFQRLAKVPVLCLDDVGAQKGSDYGRSMLVSLYERRGDQTLRTIWTSNLGLDELADYLGEDDRLASRIAGSAKIVRVDGPDHRLEQARRRAKA